MQALTTSGELAMLRLDNIFKAYGGKTVLSGFSLDIEPGERFILLGRSGCGKTTLLRLIAGFDRPDRGRIFIGGEDVGSLPVERRPVGLIFQNYALFPHMTVYDNIAVGPRVRNVSESDIRQRIGDLLEITRLGELRAAYPGELSGGEAQRVALARAIINQPKILLLDEPLSALDPNLRQTLREELVDMQKALGITFLFVTHDQEEAMTLATRMGILEEGRLLQAGTPQELYDHPVSPFVAGFLGDVNRLSAGVEKVEGRRVLVSLGAAGRLECEHRGEPALGQNALCFIRPEKMSFVDTNRTGPNALRGTITEKAFYGNHTQYHVKLDDGQTVTVPLLHGPNGKENSVAYETGARVCLRVPPASVLLFDTEEGSRDHPTD